MTRLVLTSLFLAACARDPALKASVDYVDGFGTDASARIIAPPRGATVPPSFDLYIRRGDEVRTATVLADGAELATFPGRSKKLRVELPADGGRHELVLRTTDVLGVERFFGPHTLRVVDVGSKKAPAPWVTLTHPSDGTTVTGEVQIIVEAPALVDRIRLLSDGAELTTLDAEKDLVLTEAYDIAGSHTLRAEALDAAGVVLASHETTFEVVLPRPEDTPPDDLNKWVMGLIGTYPIDGTYDYHWPSSGTWEGTTRSLEYLGQPITSADDACYCSGITFELFFRAWQEYIGAKGGPADLNGLSPEDLEDRRREWYVEELLGPGPTVAMEQAGIGNEVEGFDLWRAGDFVQLWRNNNTGHSVVFSEWVLDEDGNRVGLEYVSCQPSTDGFGVRTEYFGTSGGSLDPDHMWSGRLSAPERFGTRDAPAP